jgi:hypothetical protein
MTNRLLNVVAWLAAMTASANADLLWGVNGHPFTAYPGIAIGQQLDYLKDLGMKSYRVNISGADSAPLLEALVKEGKARGIEILPVITPGGIDLAKDSTKDLYDKAHELAVLLGTQFKNDIRVWELGNEMENYAIIKACEKRDNGTQYPCDWGPAGGTIGLDYYGPRWAKVSAVLKGLSDGMTEVDPGIRKAMGTAGWGHVGAFERMQEDGIKWDISVWHMYGEEPEWAFEKLVRYDKPIWVTEFNNLSGSQRSDRQQAEGLRLEIARLREMQATYKIEAAHIYELLDESYWAPDSEAFMGLVRLVAKPGGGWMTGEPKPAYFAVKDAVIGQRPLTAPRRDCDLAESQKIDPLPVRQVQYGYCLVLGHSADASGLDTWTGSLKGDETTLNTMLLALLRSDEFKSRYSTFGLSDRSYIAFLYLLLLNREADGGGLNAYVKQVSKGTMKREDVAVGIMSSSEFKSRHAAMFGSGL